MINNLQSCYRGWFCGLLVLMAGCGQTAQTTIDAYLKHMTEVAVTIENTRSQESATAAAERINELRSQINALVASVRALPKDQQDSLLQQHRQSITQINQRISTALSQLALRNAQARRTISDAIMRLDTL